MTIAKITIEKKKNKKRRKKKEGEEGEEGVGGGEEGEGGGEEGEGGGEEVDKLTIAKEVKERAPHHKEQRHMLDVAPATRSVRIEI